MTKALVDGDKRQVDSAVSNEQRKRVFILGSTGSIGRQSLDVIAGHADRFEVVGIAAGSNVDALVEQGLAWDVDVLGIASEEAGRQLGQLASGATVGVGIDEICELMAGAEPDVIVAAISGIGGLRPIIEALSLGITVAIANKEPLVAAGDLVMATAARAGVDLVPIDSEISAVFQCLEGQDRDHIGRVILTASGGAFRDYGADDLAEVTPEMALDHPTWQMGRKITVDSATLANKGFEIFELRWMFDLDYSQIDVVIHHQSIIHSLVELIDGSTLAQLTLPDMRFAIQYALTWPERLPNAFPRLDLSEVGELTFAEPDYEKFPNLRLAYQAGESGQSYPAVLNAANSEAVELFLEGKITFTEIPTLAERVLDDHEPTDIGSVDEVLAVDGWAHHRAAEIAAKM